MVLVDYLAVVIVQVFPDLLVVSACHHLDHHSVSVVIEMVYERDHHRQDLVAYRLSVCEDHQAWVGLVIEVMMVEIDAVQDCHSCLGHCQAEVVDPVEGLR